MKITHRFDEPEMCPECDAILDSESHANMTCSNCGACLIEEQEEGDDDGQYF